MILNCILCEPETYGLDSAIRGRSRDYYREQLLKWEAGEEVNGTMHYFLFQHSRCQIKPELEDAP